MKISPLIVTLLSLFGVMVGASITPIIALLVDYGVSTEIIAFYRLFFLSILLTPIVFGKKQNRVLCQKASGYQWILILAYSLTKGGTLLLWTEAIRAGGTPFITTTLGNLTLIFVVALSYLFYGEKVSKKGLLGIGICLIGVGIVAIADLSSGVGEVAPMVYIVLACGLSAMNALLARVAQQQVPLYPLITLGYGISCIITWLVAILRQGDFSLDGYSFLLVVLLGCFSTLISHSIPIWAVKYISPTTIQVIGLPAPFFTAILSYLLFKEFPSWYTLGGSMVIIIGLLYYLYSYNRQGEGI